ncbi:MAG TPA: histidine kinase dimerization/phospho-acceptor domain-containing protein, partial [Candidatus Saccharimonadales bacterium]|nr:histidine kinase dimerization/phospho-acceptor domain-containing protein [Candidatus Saccharimonadales bacterium]
MNTRSLRFRLIIWYAGLLTTVFLLFGVVMYQVLRHYLKQSLADSLDRRIVQIEISLLANVGKTGETYVVEEINARYAPENYDRFIRLTRQDGKVVYASGRAPAFDPAGLPPAPSDGVNRLALLRDGNRLLIRGATYGSYLIESGAPMQPIDVVLAHLAFLLLLGVPLVVLVAVAGGYVLVGRALAPVVQIARSAEQITLHNLDEQLPLTDTGDEIQQLSFALNRMIVRLREAFDQNRRFLADASHELRTPLTALRGELESAVEQASARPEWRDRVGSALEEVDRLAKIVETLFAISRLDAGEAQQEWRRFDLGRLVASTADQMSLLAEDKGIFVACEVQPEVNVEGDQARIKQVVVNLLDNAIKYTPAGGSVRLQVQPRGPKAILEVVDTGMGIPAEALPHVFERFFRVDKARSR